MAIMTPQQLLEMQNRLPRRPVLPENPMPPKIPTINIPNLPNINLPNIDFSNIPQGIKIPSIPNIPTPTIPTPVKPMPSGGSISDAIEKFGPNIPGLNVTPIKPPIQDTPSNRKPPDFISIYPGLSEEENARYNELLRTSRIARMTPEAMAELKALESKVTGRPTIGGLSPLLPFIDDPIKYLKDPIKNLGPNKPTPPTRPFSGMGDDQPMRGVTPSTFPYGEISDPIIPEPPIGGPIAQATAVEPISSSPVTQPVTQPVVQDTIAESLANIPVSGTAPTNQVDPVLQGVTPTEVLSDPFVRELYFGSPDTPGLVAQATEAAQKSFLDQPALLQPTAGLSPFEQEARGLAAAGIGSYEPFLREASGAYRGGLGSLYGSIGFGGPSARDYLGMSLEQYDPRMMGAFYDPFEQRVVQQTISDALQAAAQQDIQQRAADIARGGESAFGSRARLGAEERQRALGRGLGETLGRIRSSGFQSAQNRALQELERRRAAARSAAQLESGFGGQLSQAQRLYGADISGLGRMGQQLRGADISQLAGLGSTARGIEEQRLAREYAQQQATRMAPLQATQFVQGFAPQYIPGKTEIQKQYGMPIDPLGLGIAAAFGAYRGLRPEPQKGQVDYDPFLQQYQNLMSSAGGATGQVNVASGTPTYQPANYSYGSSSLYGSNQGSAPPGTDTQYYNQFGIVGP